MQFLSLVAVGVNCAIIYFTSDALKSILGNEKSDVYAFMIIVMIEHIIMAFKYFISLMIRDKPEWVTAEEHEQRNNNEAIYQMLEKKKEEYIRKGGVIIEDKIRVLKEGQRQAKINEQEKLIRRELVDEETKEEVRME